MLVSDSHSSTNKRCVHPPTSFDIHFHTRHVELLPPRSLKQPARRTAEEGFCRQIHLWQLKKTWMQCNDGAFRHELRGICRLSPKSSMVCCAQQSSSCSCWNKCRNRTHVLIPVSGCDPRVTPFCFDRSKVAGCPVAPCGFEGSWFGLCEV